MIYWIPDLIYTFSDGVDDDGNGYVDDISGWDFFERDNDAYHTYYDGFGTHDWSSPFAAGEGDNGGEIGHCPNCAIVPLQWGILSLQMVVVVLRPSPTVQTWVLLVLPWRLVH